MQLHDGKSTIDDWRILAICFDNSSTTENNQFMDAIHITPRKGDVHEINFAKFKLLNAEFVLSILVEMMLLRQILTLQKALKHNYCCPRMHELCLEQICL
uniref:Uncharacterized protein n=1 Tax=Rhizophagus irregularis (strain DAOM 181602 / DAOM 197198 / MUCL 43194) TaxID=747089 RepID=U9U784_RHIID